jgi:hypothetical protein
VVDCSQGGLVALPCIEIQTHAGKKTPSTLRIQTEAKTRVYIRKQTESPGVAWSYNKCDRFRVRNETIRESAQTDAL